MTVLPTTLTGREDSNLASLPPHHTMHNVLHAVYNGVVRNIPYNLPSAADVTIPATGIVDLIYDRTASVWELVGKNF